MDNTYMNIFIFLIITAIYFILAKPKLQVETLESDILYSAYMKSTQIALATYFIVIILVQFSINSVAIVQKCGGSVSQNMGIAAMITFLPWFFFMGLMMVALLLFPGWKSAFSDIIGYFAVSSSANKLLSDLLVDTSINDKLEKMNGGYEEPVFQSNNSSINSSINSPTIVQDNTLQPIQQLNQNPQNIMMGGSPKQDMQDTASAIVKLVGNMSILINQITPENFVEWWKTLKPLMKDKYQQMRDDDKILLGIKQKLLALVVARDNIGEAFWYIYTAILLISVVQLRLATHGCIKDAAQMQSNVNDLAQQKEATKTATSNGVQYTG